MDNSNKDSEKDSNAGGSLVLLGLGMAIIVVATFLYWPFMLEAVSTYISSTGDPVLGRGDSLKYFAACVFLTVVYIVLHGLGLVLIRIQATTSKEKKEKGELEEDLEANSGKGRRSRYWPLFFLGATACAPTAIILGRIVLNLSEDRRSENPVFIENFFYSMGVGVAGILGVVALGLVIFYFFLFISGVKALRK